MIRVHRWKSGTPTAPRIRLASMRPLRISSRRDICSRRIRPASWPGPWRGGMPLPRGRRSPANSCLYEAAGLHIPAMYWTTERRPGVIGAVDRSWSFHMQNKISPILAAAGLALLLTTAANAQTPIRVRGTIERVDGPTYVVKARDGTEVKVTLADNAQ